MYIRNVTNRHIYHKKMLNLVYNIFYDYYSETIKRMAKKVEKDMKGRYDEKIYHTTYLILLMHVDDTGWSFCGHSR
jgi:hypothetical protein